MPELMQGITIANRYTVVSRLGSGGMADVYLATDSELGRQVAIKVLHRRFASDPDFVNRFRQEAQAAAGLQHPNVVSVFDRGDWDGTSYIAMEYLPGRTLKDLIREEAPLDPARAVVIATQICQAAGFAHRGGIVHRDVKPQNVMVDANDHATVTDFGIARAGAGGITEAGSIMGTAHYISPEQAQGHEAGAQADIYSIGVVLYEMLTGQVPFDADSPVAIAMKQVTQTPQPPSALVAGVSPDLDSVVMWTLRKTPSDRPASTDELASALNAIAERLRPGYDTTATVAFTAPEAAAVAAAAAAMPVTGAMGATSDEAQPPVEDPEAAKKRKRNWMIAGGVAAGLAVVVGLLFATGVIGGVDTKTMPLVVGQDKQLALTVISNAGFTEQPSIQLVQSNQPNGRVIKQTPDAGAQVPSDSKITLFVSDGPGTVQIPTVADMPAADAQRLLEKLGFKVVVRQKASSDVKKGNAIATDPAAGLSILKGSQITLFVSSGQDQVSVPDVTGQALADARSTLQAAGFVVPTATTQVSDQPAGTVLSQTPSGGSKEDKGSTVTLVVSAPWIAVPDESGKLVADAKADLKAAGFSSIVTSPASCVAPNIYVASQSPVAGTDQPSNAKLTLTCGPAVP